MVDGGLITLEKVRVILYRGAKKWFWSAGACSGFSAGARVKIVLCAYWSHREVRF
jgi:hypothetical protein